jgi:hypothetical protein
MALPPSKITDRVSIWLGAPLVNDEAGQGATLTAFITIDVSSDDHEEVKFIARQGDTLKLGGERFTVESIDQTDDRSSEEDLQNALPDARSGAKVVLTSSRNPENKITLTA